MMRLLYVEDDRLNALLFSAIFIDHPLIVCEVAEDAASALELAQTWQPHVIIMDAHLGSVSAFDLLPQIRHIEHMAHVPVILCSADTPEQMSTQGDIQAFIACWQKPIVPAQALRLLEDMARHIGDTPN